MKSWTPSEDTRFLECVKTKEPNAHFSKFWKQLEQQNLFPGRNVASFSSRYSVLIKQANKLEEWKLTSSEDQSLWDNYHEMTVGSDGKPESKYSKGDLAKKYNISRSTMYKKIRELKQSGKSIKNKPSISDAEIEFLRGWNNEVLLSQQKFIRFFKDYLNKFPQKFPGGTFTFPEMEQLRPLFDRRKQIVLDYDTRKEKEEKTKTAALLVKVPFVQTPIHSVVSLIPDKRRADSLPDVGILLVELINSNKESITLSKDNNKLLHEITIDLKETINQLNLLHINQIKQLDVLIDSHRLFSELSVKGRKTERVGTE